MQGHRRNELLVTLRDRLQSNLAEQPVGTQPSNGLDTLCGWLVAELDLVGTTVTVMLASGPEGLAASSSASQIGSVDSVQFDVGEGPGRDCFARAEVVLVPDLARVHARWPGFTSEAWALGIEAVYALPLKVGAVPIGVMTSYSDRVRDLTSAELTTMTMYADVSSQIIVEQGSLDAMNPLRSPSFDEGVQIRTEVYQAQGMVMVDLEVSLDEAMDRLRAAAFADEIPLNDLARAIVTGRRRVSELPDSEPPPSL